MTRPDGHRETGWYDDPHSSNYQMYWNGTKWTGETRPQPAHARRQASIAGRVVGLIALVTILGLAFNSENWIVRAVIVMSGGMAVVPALGVWVWLNRRATRIEQDISYDEQGVDT